MHRDKKVGFALGILLIGIVAAFFFRNDPNPLDEVPQLDDPGLLDRQIAEQRLAPYITGLESVPEDKQEPQTDAQWMQPFQEDTVEDDRKSAPNPVRVFSADPAIAGTPRTPNVRPSAENAGWNSVPSPQNPTTSSPPASLASRRRETAPEQPATHRVQAGDTLSGLSLRYLGTSRRYREIYELNTDRMTSPDDLRIGMTLRLPTGSQPPANRIGDTIGTPRRMSTISNRPDARTPLPIWEPAPRTEIPRRISQPEPSPFPLEGVGTDRGEAPPFAETPSGIAPNAGWSTTPRRRRRP